jgi:hypothetical protein
MMNEFIHWLTPYLLLSSTCDEMLSWMIEVWMNNQLVSDVNCNTINIVSPPKSQGMTNNVGLTFSVGDTILRFTISIEQDN